jgi:hypothetical protein
MSSEVHASGTWYTLCDYPEGAAPNRQRRHTTTARNFYIENGRRRQPAWPDRLPRRARRIGRRGSARRRRHCRRGRTLAARARSGGNAVTDQHSAAIGIGVESNHREVSALVCCLGASGGLRFGHLLLAAHERTDPHTSTPHRPARSREADVATCLTVAIPSSGR